MSWIKISSTKAPGDRNPIESGHFICFHFAIFQDILTERSQMLSNTFLTGAESGNVGGVGSSGKGGELLHAIAHSTCLLGERSIWRLR
jgi:hypothetical protein